MADEWQWWRDALAGKEQTIDANTPQSGFYKKRDGKGGKWLPVMIRIDRDGALRCRVGSDSAADPHEVWTWCAGNPISKEDAKHAFDNGAFPGDAPTIGDNSGDLSLAQQLAEYVTGTIAWLKGRKITDKKTADQAANRRDEILRLKKEVEREWDDKARPHDEAVKALRVEYGPHIKEADEANKALRAAMTDFANAERDRLEADRRAKWQAEQKAIAAARAEIEAKQAKLMHDDPIAALTSEPEELPPMPPAPEPVKISMGGQVGKVSGLRTYWEARITDHAAALQHYANHPDVVALIQKLAKADVKNAKGTTTIPGVQPYEDRRVA